MSTFTPEQLKSMTLDELERYYNLDPNNLDICHAYIEVLHSEDLIPRHTLEDYYTSDEYERRESELQDEIDDLYSDIDTLNTTVSELEDRLSYHE